MKLNIQIDIDWIEEDGSIDEEVKASIVQGVKNAISKSCMDSMEEKSKLAIDSAILKASEKIEEKAVQFADDWLENEVAVTDKWGDLKEKTTIKGLVKAAFNDTLNQKVDKNGKISNGYGGSYTLIEYLTGKRVNDVVGERMKTFGKDIDRQIKESIDKSIKDNVSDKFAQMVIGVAKQEYKDVQALIDNQS
jgi:hypothetical protein